MLGRREKIGFVKITNCQNNSVTSEKGRQKHESISDIKIHYMWWTWVHIDVEK
jgi:hypothetical protein